MNKKHYVHFLVVILLSAKISFLNAQVYSSNSIVSYYAEDFHGKKTSCGETYNMNDLTCASKELPFNSKLKVTNLSNGRSVVVRVNDRGPFVPDRELDLSKAAAIKLDMIKSGTAHVKIEILQLGPNTKISQQTADKAIKLMKQKYPSWKPHGTTKALAHESNTQNIAPAKKTPKSSPSKTEIPPNKIWDIQLGAFSSRENANTLAQELLREGFTNVVFQKSEGIFRVVIRQVSSNDVPKVIKKLEQNGHNEYSIRERKN